MGVRLVVVLNGESQLEYDRSRPVPEPQQRFLDKMDAELVQGITLGGQRIANPDLVQRAHFVAMNLMQAVLAQNEPVAAAMCSYLATRLPDLQQVKAVQQNGELAVELVFDRPFAAEVKVAFSMPPNKLH